MTVSSNQATRERPILFSGPLVRAILDGRKTQTRRLVKPQPAPNAPHDGGTSWVWNAERGLHIPCGTVGHLTVREKNGLSCPFGVPGDRLWVRETWGVIGDIRAARAEDEFTAHIEYAADLAKRTTTVHMDNWRTSYERRGKWRPSIHMPRWASRLTLEVTGVRVERLHDISEEDARAEGVEPRGSGTAAHRAAFRLLWCELYGHASWDLNPWLWAVSFRLVPQ